MREEFIDNKESKKEQEEETMWERVNKGECEF